MRVLFPVTFALALYSAEADNIDIMVMDIPTGAPCGSGQLYNASNSPPCQDKPCGSGVAFGFDIDGKKPCCITCDTPGEELVPVCYKPWSHVTQIIGIKPDARLDEACAPDTDCTVMVAKGTNKIIQSTTDTTPTLTDTCAMFDHPSPHNPKACADPVFTDPSTDPTQCWSMPESSGSARSWGLLQVGAIGAMLAWFKII